jgi:drug/metabolite transporter (DMT)-like permease
LEKESQISNGQLLKWFLPYVLVASLQYQFTKDGLYYASPFVLMSFRYVFVGVIFYFVGGRKLQLDKDSILIAFFAAFSSIFWAIGLSNVSAGDSAVLSYTMPLFSIPIAYFVIREKATSLEVAGALVGFSGVVVYSVTLAHGSETLGAVFTIIGAVFWGGYSVYYRKLRAKKSVPILTTQFLVGSIPCLVGTAFYPEAKFTPNLIGDLLYIIIFTGLVQFYLWNGLLRRGRVGRITTLAFAVPATTIFIDYVRGISIPTDYAIVGAVLMFAGIFISNWYKVATSERHDEASETDDLQKQKNNPN